MTVPSGASTGNVVVTVNGLASNGVSFTVTVPPSISSLSPSRGPVGGLVTIAGSNFGDSQGSSTVTFHGVSADAASFWSATIIVVTVPSGASTGNVVVTVGGVASNGVSFTVQTAAPSISSVSPTTGVAGAQVAISGSGFGSERGTGAVWLGSTSGTIVSWSDTLVVAKVASNATSGTARVQQGGVWSSAVVFDVATATISSVTPASGAPGDQVTITGSGFGAAQGNGQVWLGTANGVVQSWGDAQVVAVVAAGSASGKAQVLQNGVLSNLVQFDVNTLHVTGVSPTSGSPGTAVTFTGSGFGSSQGAVQLGSTGGQVLSWSETQVVAKVAPDALTGIARVQQGGASSNAVAFTVTAPGGNPVTLEPNLINMVVGDTHKIQATSPTGQPVTGLTWTSSDPNVVSLSSDDSPVLSALAVGHATITAGTASCDVTVSAGDLPLPPGTVLWSNPGNGSGVARIVPAVPSPSGVADVFAFQEDGTVQAITSDGTTAWTADISRTPVYWASGAVLPDFQGGLVFVEQNSDGTYSIVKLNGITGQRDLIYVLDPTTRLRAGEIWDFRYLAVHTDGTIFAVIQHDIDPGLGYQPASVIGIDPATGGLKFSVTIPIVSEVEMQYGLMIAGDGYVYLPYSYVDWSNGFRRLRLLRVDSSGAYDNLVIYDLDHWVLGDIYSFNVQTITNADKGILLSWSSPTFGSGPVDWHMASTTGASVSLIGAPQVPDQGRPVTPVLQAQDGSFVGTTEDLNGTQYMVAFDANGSLRWSVAGSYQP